MRWRTVYLLVASVAGLWAQAPPRTTLDIDVDNAVIYWEDVPDLSKWATIPGPVPRDTNASVVMKSRIAMGDIVAVNGKPVKGFWTLVFRSFMATTSLTPGRVISDFAGGCVLEGRFVFLNQDGSVIGSIVTGGNNSGVPPPGAPVMSGLSTLQAVTGGTGAFLGVRGQASMSGSPRAASIAEDPAYRRVNGGVKVKHYIQVVPMIWPEVLTTAAGPTAFHAGDWSPITASSPARAGEQVILSVSGLGPVQPNYDLTKPFPAFLSQPLSMVNSPVEVMVNGKATQATNTVGWPEWQNVYRVDFVMPEGSASGMATVSVSAGWINGSEVKIPVR